jgi:hypothetical protein
VGVLGFVCLRGIEHYNCSSVHIPMSLMFSKVLPDIPNYLSVNSTGDTILELEVHFGNGVIGENGGIRDITY